MTARKLMIALWITCGVCVPKASQAKEPLVAATAVALVGYVGGKLLDELFVDPIVLNKPNLKKLKEQIEGLAARDQQHAESLYALSKRLDTCATREDVRQAMKDTLTKVDRKLAEHAERIRQIELAHDGLYRELNITRSDLEHFKRSTLDQFERHSRILGDHERRLTQTEDSLREIMRWNPGEQAERLGVAGFESYDKRDFATAADRFRHAVAYAPEDPSGYFGLSLAYKGQGKAEMAEQMVAFGIAAMRFKQPSDYYRNCMLRVQGWDRQWLEDRLRDPVLGSRSSGVLRVVEFEAPSPKVTTFGFPSASSKP